jgi:opacity protein-like surface antigen
MTNKTTKICCTLALLATTAATPAFSQIKNFSGPSISLGVNQSSGTTETSFTTDVSSFSTKNGDHNTIPFIDLAYGFPLSNNWLFKVGGRYDFSKTKSGSLKSDITVGENEVLLDAPEGEDNVYNVNDVGEILNLNYSFKNHNSLYIAPTYLISDKTAVFGKVGYHQIKGELNYKANYTLTDPDYTVNENSEFLSDVNDTASKNFKGWGYGVGLTTMISNNLFLQVEGEYVNYKGHTVSIGDTSYKFKPESLNASISVGYKF